MSAVRLCFVGAGKFACAYHLPLAMASSHVEIVAFVDPAAPDEIRRIAGDFGASVYRSLDEVPGEEVDAVVISTPHALHAMHVDAALSAGWHVLVDKPFVLATTDAIRLARCAAERKLVGAVAFTRRFDRAYRHARELLASGALGALRYVDSVQLGYPSSGWYVDPLLGGGGPLIGRGTHLVDIVPWMLGCAPSAVRAEVIAGEDGRVDVGAYVDVELESVRWRATLLAAGDWMHDGLRIFGDDGYLEFRRPASETVTWDVRHLTKDDVEVATPERGHDGSALEDFVEAIVSGRDPSCSFTDAIASVRVVEAIYQSSSQGRRIEVPRPPMEP